MDKDCLAPIIDGDFIPYRGGFSADTQAKETWGVDGYLEQDYLKWALGNVNATMEFLLGVTFKNHPWHKLYIGGSGNYRDTIATTIPSVLPGWKYKGNRDSLHKPKYFAEIREHLVNRWGAEMVNGRETDDAVSCLQFKYTDRSTCIVSQDKDLFCCPGQHYNPVDKTWEYTTIKEADLHFRHQTLTGDWSSDYIPGLTGIAKKTADEILKECDYDLKAIDRKTLQLYNKEFGQQGAAVLRDNQNLLFIQRQDWRGFSGEEIKWQSTG